MGAAEVRVVARIFSGQQSMNRMMEVIAPLRMHAEAAIRRWSKYADVVEIALRDHLDLPPEMGRQRGNLRRQFGEERISTSVEDAVHRIEPQGIEVELAQPIQR